MDREECVAFAAQMRGKAPPVEDRNKMGWNGTTNCTAAQRDNCKAEYLAELQGGTHAGVPCDCAPWGDAWNNRTLYQTTVRDTENAALPSGCIYSDYFLSFYYNTDDSDMNDASQHHYRVGKVPALPAAPG